MTELNAEAIAVIEQLGGNAMTAAICEVSKAAVSQWRHNGIPKMQRRFLKLTHPELFSDEIPTTPPIPK